MEGGVEAIRSAGKERRRASHSFPRASAQKPIRLDREQREEPRRSFEVPGGVCGLGGSAVFGSSPQPSGLPEPAGRFHRGATRGELDSISGNVDDTNT